MLWRTTCSPFSLALYLAFVFCRSQAQDHPNGPQSHPDAGRRACAELQSQLDDTRIQTSTSSSPDYRNASSGAWNRFNALSEPSCVALPRSASDVQTVMRSIFRHRVHYAVQAGGHSAGAGWSSVQGGILISFMYMRSVSYDAALDVVTLQPGVRWGEAAHALEPSGVAVLGGRMGAIGTGLLLGGGLNFLSAMHGYSVDALVEADVVLVNGDLVTATPTNAYSDLFKALKGGANRFGIVTRYVVKPAHVGRQDTCVLYGGTIFYDGATSEALLKATANFINNVKDPKASLLTGLSVSLANNTIFPVNLVTFFYNGTSPPPGIYDEFLAIPSLDGGINVKQHSYIEALASLGTGREGSGQGQIFGASAFASLQYEQSLGPRGSGSDPYVRYLNAYRDFLQYAEKVRGKPGPAAPHGGVGHQPRPEVDDPTKDGIQFSILAFTAVQESQIEVGRARGGNAIAPPMTNHALVQFHTQMPPGCNEVPRRVRDARREFLQQIGPTPGIPLYINECDVQQNVFSTYGEYDFLRRTYRKYDPTRFNVRFTDGPIGL